MAARQYDAWDLGMVSSDDFTNADVRYEQSFSNIRASLTRTNGGAPEIPIVTGFLARGESTGTYFPRVAFQGLCTSLAVFEKRLSGLSRLSLCASSLTAKCQVADVHNHCYITSPSGPFQCVPVLHRDQTGHIIYPEGSLQHLHAVSSCSCSWENLEQ